MAYGLSTYPDQMPVTQIGMSQIPQVHQNFLSHLMSILQPTPQQGIPIDHSGILARLGVMQPTSSTNRGINILASVLQGGTSGRQVDDTALPVQQFQPLLPVQQYGGFGGFSR